jgi:hypothetical protein
MKWVHKRSPPPKRARMQNLSGKMMEGILLIEYMKKGSTITGEVYKETIRMLKTAIQQKKLHNCDQKMMLLRENCRVRKSCQVSSIDECGFPEMEHPPYSPDLAPPDY